MAGKSNSQQPSGSTQTKLNGLDLIGKLCPEGVVDVVNYYLLNRKLRGLVSPIGGLFMVDGFRVHIQADENQRLESGGVSRYNVKIEEGEVQYKEIPSEVIRPIVEQLRVQKKGFEDDIEAIESLMADDEKAVSEQNTILERLEAEKLVEEDEARLDAIASEIEDATNKKLAHEQNLTTARQALGEKKGLLLNVDENLATELETGEFEPSVKLERINKQFPFETFVS